MSSWYGIQGEVRCHDTPQSREVLQQLLDLVDRFDCQIEVDEKDDGSFTVLANAGEYCSGSTAMEMDDAILALGPYAIEVGYFATTYEDETSDLWVGRPDEVAKAIRAAVVRDAKAAMKKLTAEEGEQLMLELASTPGFWTTRS